MAIHNKRFTQIGQSVSRDLPAGERSFDSLVYQSGKPVLDSELNLSPEVLAYAERLLRSAHHPSGFIRTQTAYDSIQDYEFLKPGDDDFVDNGFAIKKMIANVAGRPVVVEYSNTSKSKNIIQLDEAPINGGTNPDVKRTDFVFLEVWLAQVASSPSAEGWIQINAVDADGNHALVNGDQIQFTNAAGDAFLLEAGVDFYLEEDDGMGGTIAWNVNQVAASLQAAIDALDGFNASGTADIVYIRSTDTGEAGNGCFYEPMLLDPASGAITPHTPPVGGKCQFAGGIDTPNKPTQDKIYRHGNVLSPEDVALSDDIRDMAVAAESTQRVQLQYRIRKTGSTEAVNHKTECDGFSSPSVWAQGSGEAPVENYRFLRADGESVDPDGPTSALQYGRVDNGLWIAGNGSEESAEALGSVDGFVYALPICFVFRRNNAYVNGSGEPQKGAGFNPQHNTNGALPWNHAGLSRDVEPIGGNAIMGSIPAGESDRPDGAFSNVIEDWDVLDLRRHSLPTGADLSAELRRQIQHLLDGSYHTWAIDATSRNTLGTTSGDVSTQYLACNEIGRHKDSGATNSWSGATGFGEFIRNFDHVARRFGDQPVVERLVVEFFCDDGFDANHGKFVTKKDGTKKWYEGDTLHLNLEALNATTRQGWGDPEWANELGTVAEFMPPGTVITDILGAWHDDGNYNEAIDQHVQLASVIGVGTRSVVLELDANHQKATGGIDAAEYNVVGDVDNGDNGSPRRIFVEFEISYPMGVGLTETPDRKIYPGSDTVYPHGEMIENRYPELDPATGRPVGRPLEMEKPLPPKFREGFREVVVEMVANCGEDCHHEADPYTEIRDSIVSLSPNTLRPPRRVWGDKNYAVSITDSVSGDSFNAHEGTDLTDCTEYGSSSRNVRIAEGEKFSGVGQTLCDIVYYAQDPISNWGGDDEGYQVSIYYRTNAPQTCGIKEADFHTEGADSGPLPTNLKLEILAISDEVWTGQVGMGSLELGFPYVAPLDQIPAIKSTLHSDAHPAEWQFCASTVSTVDDFDATTGILALHPFLPMDKTTVLSLGDLENPPFADGEFRAVYPFADDNSYRPTVFAQSHSGVVRHKVFYPVLTRSLQDSRLFRKGELLLVVFSRWGECDDDNTVRFTDSDNQTCAAVYRTKDMLMTVGD
ncbi:MAG: hypothetical protein VXX11_03115 [Planctomycetota bacterium]|nr:hypothetical protein [Planctomycetota bacterium]